jgi:hypothetical protein
MDPQVMPKGLASSVHSTNKVWHSKISWTYLQILFQSIFFFDKASKYGDGAKF